MPEKAAEAGQPERLASMPREAPAAPAAPLASTGPTVDDAPLASSAPHGTRSNRRVYLEEKKKPKARGGKHVQRKKKGRGGVVGAGAAQG